MATCNDNLFIELERIIRLTSPAEKCSATHAIYHRLSDSTIDHCAAVNAIEQPGYPAELNLVAPRELKRRGIQSQVGRNILMHAIAHIEFNAINLALDAAYRFRDQPIEYYQDWLSIASDEARHFSLIQDYLAKHDCQYGDYAGHNGLWEMAVKTDHDIVARMALVPRVLEARGLDVTPGMIRRLQGVGDQDAIDILNVIYQDEIGHVEKGSFWFFHQCKLRNLEPKSTFIKMVETHLHGELRGPFNISARLQAGFDEDEMAYLDARYSPIKQT